MDYFPGMTTAPEPVPTADEAFGLVVHEAMFRQRVSQTKLAAALGITQSALSKKLHGTRPWTLADTIAVADALRLDLRDLLAGMWRDPGSPAEAKLAPGPLAQSEELRTFNPLSGNTEIGKVLPFRPRQVPQELSIAIGS